MAIALTGGLRQRFIRDSLYNMLHDSLDALGWFDAGRNNAAINMIARAVPEDEEIPINTLALSPGDLDAEDWEMGSNLAEHTWIFYVDFYGENDSVATHMIGDVRDILAGRMPDAGRVRPHVPVYDYRDATPSVQFYCEIDEIIIDRAVDFPRPWQKHWWVCRFMITDYYGNDDYNGGSPGDDYDVMVDAGDP